MAKRKGDTAYMVDERDEDLMKAYHKMVGGNFFQRADLYVELSKVAAPRFYVLGERAYVVIRKMQRGKCKKMYALREKMYKEIEWRAQQYVKKRGGTFINACRVVVEQRAPSFYLSVGTIRNIVNVRTREEMERDRKR